MSLLSKEDEEWLESLPEHTRGFQEKVLYAEALDLTKNMNSDGTIALFHVTPKKNAESIENEGFFKGSYFATSFNDSNRTTLNDFIEQDKFKYGYEVFEINVNPKYLRYEERGGTELICNVPLIKNEYGVYEEKIPLLDKDVDFKKNSIKSGSILEFKRENIQHNLFYVDIDKNKIEIIFRADDGGIIPVADAQAIDALNGYQKKDDFLKVKLTRIIHEDMLLDILNNIQEENEKIVSQEATKLNDDGSEIKEQSAGMKIN